MSNKNKNETANDLVAGYRAIQRDVVSLLSATAMCLPGLFVSAFLASMAAIAAVPNETRDTIDRLIGSKGSYASEEGVYKIVLPRAEATIVLDYQTLSPNLGLNSWVAFASGVHNEAILTGQFLVLDDEVNPVLGTVLGAGLDVTGLVASHVEGRHLFTIDVNGFGAFSTLASAFRKGLDETQRVRRSAAISRKKSAIPTVPVESAIDPAPLDTVLSMRGTLVGGVYKAAIGSPTLLNGELVGREMGISTWISVAGKNDHALAQGEFIESPNGLRKLLSALRAKGINIASIRNHTLGEHPQWVFVKFWGEGSAIELARAIRYALDVQIGAVLPGSGEKI